MSPRTRHVEKTDAVAMPSEFKPPPQPEHPAETTPAGVLFQIRDQALREFLRECPDNLECNRCSPGSEGGVHEGRRLHA